MCSRSVIATCDCEKSDKLGSCCGGIKLCNKWFVALWILVKILHFAFYSCSYRITTSDWWFWKKLNLKKPKEKLHFPKNSKLDFTSLHLTYYRQNTIHYKCHSHAASKTHLDIPIRRLKYSRQIVCILVFVFVWLSANWHPDKVYLNTRGFNDFHNAHRIMLPNGDLIMRLFAQRAADNHHHNIGLSCIYSWRVRWAKGELKLTRLAHGEHRRTRGVC